MVSLSDPRRGAPEQASSLGRATNDNTISGTSDEDRLKNRKGNDTLLGLAGNDWLYGRDGDDLIDGGSEGKNRARGCRGHDTFVLHKDARLFIKDFNVIDDVIVLPEGETTINRVQGKNRTADLQRRLCDRCPEGKARHRRHHQHQLTAPPVRETLFSDLKKSHQYCDFHLQGSAEAIDHHTGLRISPIFELTMRTGTA